MESNGYIIHTKEKDDFDKMLIIEGWFRLFTPTQRTNIVKHILENYPEIRKELK